MRVRILALLTAALALLAVATPAQAIKGGVPDEGAHPYVGELLFYVPSAEDPRFDDPGAWFTCTGTLISPTIVVTAGHCAFDIGENGEDTAATTGGNDVWISFAEEPDFSILPDRKSTRLNSSHTVIYTLSLHDALPISLCVRHRRER